MPSNVSYLDQPIPGENFTSDTRNYPWHRPPEITDLDQGVEASIKQLTTREGAYSLLTMLQSGVSVVKAADIFCTSGIAKGKWTPDFALMLGGPVSHMIKLMAEGYGVKYEMGLDDKHLPTINYVKAAAEIDPNKAVTVAENVAGQAEMFKTKAEGQQAGGFMGSPGPNLEAQAETPTEEPQAEAPVEAQGDMASSDNAQGFM